MSLVELATFVVLLAAVGSFQVEGEELVKLSEAIPRKIKGWQATSPDRFFDRRTLYDYIDGGAELYLAYNFHKVLAREYSRPGRPSILLDIFDMGTPADAFGVFTAERLGEDVGIGEGSEYEPGLLRFWRGRFFVSITAMKETKEVKEAIFALGGEVAKAIGKPTREPSVLLQLLPPKGLQKLGVRLFRTHEMLNRFKFLAKENILGLGRDCEGIIAPYRRDKKMMHLLLVLYPNEERARRGEEEFTKSIKAGRRPARTKEEKFASVARRGRLLMAVLGAPTSKGAQSFLEQVSTLCGKFWPEEQKLKLGPMERKGR